MAATTQQADSQRKRWEGGRLPLLKNWAVPLWREGLREHNLAKLDGALDLFVDECLDYTARLIGAGVAAELIVYPGCFHGFRMAQEAAVTRRAEADSLRALEKALTR